MPEQQQSQPEVVASAPVASPAPAPSWKQNMGIPIAIVIAAALIAGAIYFDGERGGSANMGAGGTDGAEQVTPEREVAPVTKDDHIRGNPNAPIMIIEYSDYDCPFCRVYHDTLKRISTEYGKDGKVAWVYRHFPIVQLHPSAPKISEAAYCVTELGGNDAFWKFTDAVNESREIQFDANGRLTKADSTNMTRITEFATTAGVDKNKFELCYNSGKYAETVREDVAEAAKAGARGTPYSVIIAGEEQIPIDGGAVPYEMLKGIIDSLIAQMDEASGR